jgi:hypothetical protein
MYRSHGSCCEGRAQRVSSTVEFDGAYSDLEELGGFQFIRKFDGFNLTVARQFALSFDGCRAKVGDVQLEITEQFLSLATSLPVIGQKWSKNYKVDNVPWTLLFQSRTVDSCDRGLPAKMLKPAGMIS